MLKMLMAIVLLAMMPASALAQWREVETPHFIIYSDDKEEKVARFAERLEKYDRLMRMATGLDVDLVPVKVRIYVVEAPSDIEEAIGTFNSGILGFYDSNMMGPFAVTPRRTFLNTNKLTSEMVLVHEYAHHFMLQYFPSTYPQWYVEGFAELLGSSKVMPDGRIGYGMPAEHRGGYIALDWLSLEELLLKPPRKLPPYDLYGQGWALTHYLTFNDERAGQMRQYLAALRAGREPQEAAAAFGDLAALNRDARSYLRRGQFEYRPVEVTLAGPVIERSRLLTAAEADLIPETIALRDDDLALYRKAKDREREAKKRAKTLERIREKAARHAADPYALYLLTEAESASGNFREAEAAADRLLAIRPDHSRGLARKALAMLHSARDLPAEERAARARQARALIVKANRADPNELLPLVALYQSYALAGQAPTKAAVEGLQIAVDAQPQDMRTRQMLVDRFAAEKRWAEAIAYLRPIANSPHESPRREQAREQMAELEAALAAGSPA